MIKVSLAIFVLKLSSFKWSNSITLLLSSLCFDLYFVYFKHSPCVCVIIVIDLMMCFVAVAAGSAFCQAARLHMQMQNKLDSATSFVDAGNAYKKADPQGGRVSLITAKKLKKAITMWSIFVL